MQGEACANLYTLVTEIMLETVDAVSRDREGVGSLGNNSKGLLYVEASEEIELKVGAVIIQS